MFAKFYLREGLMVSRVVWEKRFLLKLKNMLDTTHQKGLSTELHCLQDFIELGFQCLTPFGDSCKYDIAVDINGKFIRIQCKTAHWSTDTMNEKVAFEINTNCQTTNTQKTIRHKYNNEQIDYFYTYFNGQGYLVSIEEATGLRFRWRYEYPSTGQKKGIHIADNYKIEEVVKTLII